MVIYWQYCLLSVINFGGSCAGFIVARRRVVTCEHCMTMRSGRLYQEQTEMSADEAEAGGSLGCTHSLLDVSETRHI